MSFFDAMGANIFNTINTNSHRIIYIYLDVQECVSLGILRFALISALH